VKDQEYSIVIASIGRSCLNETLNDILVSSKLPSEVIIVLPEGSSFTLEPKYKECNLNISFFYATKGQVKQRQAGLLKSNCDIIVQLDDDVRFNENVLSSLVHEVSENENNVISPLVYSHNFECQTGTELVKNPFLRFLLGADEEKEFLGIGYISRIGIAIRPSNLESRGLIGSDWLPGGCMAYHKNFSVVGSEIISPEGKFYGEDIINTHIMKEKGAVLFFANNLIVQTPFLYMADIRNVVSHFKSLIFIQKIKRGQILYLRTIFFCLIRYLRSLFPKKKLDQSIN